MISVSHPSRAGSHKLLGILPRQGVQKRKAAPTPNTKSRLLTPEQITARLALSTSVNALLEVISTQFQGFNETNLGLALFRCGEFRLADADGSALLQQSTVVAQLIAAVRQNTAFLNPKQLAEVIWGLAQIDYAVDVDLMDNLAVQVYNKLASFTAQQLACTLWGFARLGYVPAPRLSRDAHTSLLRNLHYFTPKYVCDMLWSFARMEFRPDDALLQGAQQMVSEHIDDLSLEDLIQFLWSYSQFHFQPNVLILDMVVQRLTQSLHICNPETVVSVFPVLTSLAYIPPSSLVASVVEAVRTKMSQIPFAGLCRFLESLIEQNFHPGANFLLAVEDTLLELTSLLSAEELAQTLKAFSVFNHHTSLPTLRKCAVQIDSQLSLFDIKQLSEILWSYALFSQCTADVWNTITTQFLHIVEQAPGSMDERSLCLIYQVYLLLDALVAGLPGYTVPSKLMVHGWNAWKGHLDRELTSTSQMYLDVDRCLKFAGVACSQKRLTDNGLFVVDFALLQLPKVVIMVNDSKICFGNNFQPHGEVAFKTRLLEAHGLKVISVNYHDWQGRRTDVEKTLYLQSLLKAITR